MDFTFRDDKNKSMAKTGANNLQTMKKIAMSILRLVKESYKISMKRIRYELSLDFENEIERMLCMLNIDSIKKRYSRQEVLPINKKNINSTEPRLYDILYGGSSFRYTFCSLRSCIFLCTSRPRVL